MGMLAFSFFFYLFLFFTHTTSNNICNPSSCLPSEYPVRFPFHLIGVQQDRCGYGPGYSLSCNINNRTTLNLPTGDVIVKAILYSAQTVLIDPQFCEPNRILNFSLVDTPFNRSITSNYTFFNCSSNSYRPWNRSVLFDCLSGPNFTVFAMPTEYSYQVTTCRNIISEISIPVDEQYDRELYSSDQELELQWYMPECLSCESNGGTCGTLPKHPQDVICINESSSSDGPTQNVQYVLVFLIGLLVLLGFSTGLGYLNRKVRAQSLQTTSVSSTTIRPQPTLVMGLSKSTIELCSKTVFGEQTKQPKPNENTCATCLSDYRPKEELRTIPECCHYFHSECIEEWLSVNATCPVCRKNTQNSEVMPSSI